MLDPKRSTRNRVWTTSGTSIDVVGKERGFWKLQLIDKHGSLSTAVSKKRPFEDGVAAGRQRQQPDPAPQQHVETGGKLPVQQGHKAEVSSVVRDETGVLERLERMEKLFLPQHIPPTQHPQQHPQHHRRSMREEILDLLLTQEEDAPVQHEQFSPEAFWRRFASRRRS